MTGPAFFLFFCRQSRAPLQETEYFRLHTFAHEWYFAAHF